jgi:ribosomal protein S12 methylthiotransferase accessory factor YcaO
VSLVEAIEHYQSALHRFGEVLSFEISPLDRSDIPVTSCSLVADGRMTQHGNGYGPTPEAATVSGLGELAEGVLSARLVGGLRDEAIRGSRRELVAAQGAARVADPPTLCLPAGSPYTPDMPLTWLPLRRVRTGETVWVPLDFVASDPAELAGEPALITPVSNGRGAGLEPARPIAHGVGEILQRRTNGLRFRALDRLSPVIDPDRLPPAVRDLLEGLRSRGIEPVLKHAATELGVVSTYAMGLDDDPASRIMVTACGEAAHPDAAVSPHESAARVRELTRP